MFVLLLTSARSHTTNPNRFVLQDKPYLEAIEPKQGESDESVALRSWQRHLKRNASVIVDLFHGLLRSRTACPNAGCGKVQQTACVCVLAS